MSDPLSDVCVYCGSGDVLDDAWFCSSTRCYRAYIMHDALDQMVAHADDIMERTVGYEYMSREDLQALIGELRIETRRAGTAARRALQEGRA